MTKIIITIALALLPLKSYGVDCSKIKPFKSDGTQKVSISVTRIFWNSNHEQEFEDVCKKTITFKSYDVRGREEEAFYCLLPEKNELLECNTNFDGNSGIIMTVPATWIRNWKPKANREYRFHAYVIKKSDTSYMKDIFSRVLLANLKKQSISLEGALKTGSSNPNDGFFIRAEFLE